ncbi:MAG: 1,2-phenylacetyl-CoA epoxidase subunit PaaC, partial [Steroidobacteraceae bacterium]
HLYDGLTGSRDPLVAAVATKAVKEVQYHQVFASDWTMRLGDGTTESHERMQTGLVRLWPYVPELFDEDPTVSLAPSGVAIDPRTFADAWRADVARVISAATLTVPETWTSPSGGRRGVHTEHLGHLLGEMQHLQRSYPGARW